MSVVSDEASIIFPLSSKDEYSIILLLIFKSDSSDKLIPLAKSV